MAARGRRRERQELSGADAADGSLIELTAHDDEGVLLARRLSALCPQAAALAGRQAVVTLLLEKGANMELENIRPAQAPTPSRDLHGAEPPLRLPQRAPLEHPWHMARSRLTFTSACTPPRSGDTALSYACVQNQPTVAAQLLAAGADHWRVTSRVRGARA